MQISWKASCLGAWRVAEARQRENREIPFWRSLKGKSLVFLALLFIYCLVLTVYVFSEKASLIRELEALELIREQETVIVEADLAAFSAITDLFMMVDPGGRDEVLTRVHRHFTQLQQKYSRLSELYPDRAPSFRDIAKQLAEAVVQPTPQHLGALRVSLAENKRRLDALMAQNRQRREDALDAYLAHSDRVAMVSLFFGGAGLLVLGIIVALFFGRLTRELLQLHSRVGQVVKGFRGTPLETSRSDELGGLIHGVNDMADDLRLREQELEIERQKQFHMDKMGTIGHLAAGVVHEVGNPVAAILGLAEEARQQLDDPEAVHQNLDYIIEYTNRLRRISEDLAAFNRPQRDRYELLDLNEVVSSVENILRYDERWYGIGLTDRLDPQLPAIVGASDQLSQLIMNLVLNAFEATEAGEASPAEVRIETQAGEEGVWLRVVDNGVGISPEEQGRIFDAFYTTKEGKGSGLGLLLCSSIVTAHGGYIQVDSSQGEGTRVEVFLPLNPGVGAEIDNAEKAVLS
ncbi:sensor histidine kinase [Motiliproteus sp. SC1-56]|uniref:sensor histidine kinase n=1 Tax=Motiliproteus sp. SC1-56 TaxID=2799565 RepID=UPI001A8D9235|nr:sensor histidine kinase [Motiliproteus sp. SC1-56]